MKALQTFIAAILCAVSIVLGLTMPSAANPGQDLLVGNGTAGPYPLSWRNIDANTEIVQVNQQTQMRDIDYTLDANAGTVTFTKPLSLPSAVSVHYDYDPAQAVRSSVTTSVPLSFDLAARGGSKVSFDALYQGAETSPGASPGSLTLGLGTRMQGGGGQMSTRLIFAPSLRGADTSGSSGDNLSRTGFVFSGSTQAARTVQLSLGYARAGAQLSTAFDNGLTAGCQNLSFGTALAPSKQFKAAINWAQSSSVAGSGAAAATQMSAAVTVEPAANVSLQTHWADAAGGSVPAVQTVDASLHAAPTSTSAIDIVFASKNSGDQSQNTQAVNLSAALKPSKAVAINAGMSQTRDTLGPVNQQQVSIALTPAATVQLQTGVALYQTETAQTCTTTVGGQFQPVSFLQVAATYKDRTASVGDPLLADNLDTSLVSLTLFPLRSVRLTGSYAQNPDSGSATPQALAQHGLGLETNIGLLSVSGGYDWQRPSATQIVGTTLHLGVGLQFSKTTQFSGTYAQTLADAGGSPTGTNQYGFGLTHLLGDRCSLSMSGTMQQPISPVAVATPDYTANASLGVRF